MASEVIAYVAMGLNGYIAREGGSVDFLGFGWPYGGTPGLVLTTRERDTPDGATITFSAEPTGDAIRDYSESFERRRQAGVRDIALTTSGQQSDHDGNRHDRHQGADEHRRRDEV